MTVALLTRMKRLLSAISGALWLAACASDPADLPAGWEAAERIEELEQMPCAGSAITNMASETLEWSATRGGLAVSYDHAHFRCKQDVEGFMKRGGAAIDILVQPIDMDPEAVVRCDCLYDISMRVPAPKGDYSLTLYRRGDNINMPNEPMKVGASEVTIE